MHFPFFCFDSRLKWEVKYKEAFFWIYFPEACSKQEEFISANVLREVQYHTFIHVNLGKIYLK